MASEAYEDRIDGRDTEAAITLGVLHAVDSDAAVTQRRLAGDLGIALGLTNAYLRRCVRKGWVKIRQAPPNRYFYYLTPKGFAEKSRLTGEYLSDSFKFFRSARNQCTAALNLASEQGWRRIALYGASELAEVVTLCDTPLIEIVAVVDPVHHSANFAGLPVRPTVEAAGVVDAVVVTALKDSQAVYETLVRLLPPERILVPSLLRVSQNTTTSAGD